MTKGHNLHVQIRSTTLTVFWKLFSQAFLKALVMNSRRPCHQRLEFRPLHWHLGAEHLPAIVDYTGEGPKGALLDGDFIAAIANNVVWWKLQARGSLPNT